MSSTFFVIQVYQRPWYIENYANVLMEQMPAENIYVADSASTNPALLAVFDRLEARGCHVARRTEHCWCDKAKNDGWRWAIERGAEFVFVGEDGVLPSLNVVEEMTAVLSSHESFWVGAPIMSNTPRLAPATPFEPGPIPSGRVADGQTDERARVFTAEEALERARGLATCCRSRSPQWRTTDHLDSVLLCAKAECWEVVGLLDEGFGQGVSTDSDYFWRVAQAGGEMVICERAFADHFRDDFDFGLRREIWPQIGAGHLNAKYGGRIPLIPCRYREGDD